MSFNHNGTNSDNSQYRSIILGPAFDNLTVSGQRAIYVHEYYHIYAAKNDQGIYESLRLSEKGYSSDGTTVGYSRAFTSWLNDNCPQQRPSQ